MDELLYNKIQSLIAKWKNDSQKVDSNRSSFILLCRDDLISTLEDYYSKRIKELEEYKYTLIKLI